MTDLTYRVLQLAYKHRLSHLGSCLGVLPILEEIYTNRQSADPVILSAGHAGLALYVALEEYCGKDAEDLLNRHGVHPAKNAADGTWCSTGSLGLGLPIACGRALADRSRNVWCVISDGECREGSVTESFQIMRDQQLTNLKVFLHWNGYGAYRETGPSFEEGELAFLLELCPWLSWTTQRPEDLGIPFIKGQAAHYYQMSDADWEWVEANRETNQGGM